MTGQCKTISCIILTADWQQRNDGVANSIRVWNGSHDGLPVLHMCWGGSEVPGDVTVYQGLLYMHKNLLIYK